MYLIKRNLYFFILTKQLIKKINLLGHPVFLIADILLDMFYCHPYFGIKKEVLISL